jgi:hypothetical protein
LNERSKTRRRHVLRGYPEVEGVVEVAVHDPFRGGGKPCEPFAPIVEVGGLLAAAPIMDIEVDHRKRNFFGELARKRRLAGSRAADHHDATH